MIYLYSGVPGSGKSLHSAADIDRYVRKHKNVIVNYELNRNFWGKRVLRRAGKIIEMANDALTVPFLVQFSEENHKKRLLGGVVEKQTLLVIDECQNMFNCRTWNQKDRQQWAEFFRQHRKLGFTVILITQDISFMDKQIRKVIEFNYEHRNLKNYKIFGRLLSLLTGGNFFVVVVTWLSNGKRDHTEFFRGKRKYYRLYDTSKVFDMSKLKNPAQG